VLCKLKGESESCNMSHEVDQVEEMQALEAIFMQDLTVHSSSPHSFSLWLVPHSDDSQPNHGIFTFQENEMF
jgi:hypothetical protein